jgi:hypothetical protein
MTAAARLFTPLRDVFERYHVGWETRNPDLIASLRSEDAVFHVHDGSDLRPLGSVKVRCKA